MTDIHRSLPRHAEARDWHLGAACRQVAGEIFFHPDGERGPARARREAQAKAVCRRCSVIRQCRSYALAAREPYGVWGGLSRRDRDLIAGPAGTLAAQQSDGDLIDDEGRRIHAE